MSEHRDWFGLATTLVTACSAAVMFLGAVGVLMYPVVRALRSAL